MNAADHRLEDRDGLPEALRVLLRDYPREAWEADPNFSALIRFWLDRHMMFRRLIETLDEDAARMIDRDLDPADYARRMARLGQRFLGELHGHHQIEDLHYFPRLKGLERGLERGFDILDRDHHDIDGHLATFAEEANAVLRAMGSDDRPAREVSRFRDGVKRMGRFLDRHLTDEEELVVPVLLKHAPEGLS